MWFSFVKNDFLFAKSFGSDCIIISNDDKHPPNDWFAFQLKTHVFGYFHLHISSYICFYTRQLTLLRKQQLQMKHFNTYFINNKFISSIILCLFFSVCLTSTQAQNTITYTFENESGVYDLIEHESATFKQEIERIDDNKSIVRITISKGFPKINSTYPISGLPGEMQPYLQPTSHIQSDAPEIKRVADMIKSNTDFDHDLWHLVSAVLRWNHGTLRYGNPSDIPTALDAYNDTFVNCIGFVHLPAAILRNMGIPARVVRTFMVRGSRLTRHYLLEVYFPEDDVWVTFEPQTLSTPMRGNVAVFVDNNWNQQEHIVSRNFSIDPKTFVRHGVPYQVKPIDETGQLPRHNFDPDGFDIPPSLGLTVSGYGEDVVAIGYGEPKPGPRMNSETHLEQAEIVFYTPKGDGYHTQSFAAEDVVEGEYLPRGWNGGSYPNQAYTISGTTFGTNFAKPNPQLRTHMHERWTFVLFNRFLQEPDENAQPWRESIPRRQHFRGDTLQRGMLAIFHKSDGGEWKHHQNIFNPFISETNHFGDEVVVTGNTMFVSAANTMVNESQSGEVVVYELDRNNQWQFAHTIKRESPERRIRYGNKIAADDQYLIIADLKGLHIYDRRGKNYDKADYIPFDFGVDSVIVDEHNPTEDVITSLSMDGRRIAAGFGHFNGQGTQSGAVMIFEKEGDKWMQTTCFTPEEIQENNQFGINVALKGHQLFVSAHHMGTSLGTNSGGIFVFEPLENDLWVSTALMRAKGLIPQPFSGEPTGKGGENLGFDMVVLDEQVIAGAPGIFMRNFSKNWGSIYTFDIPQSAFALSSIESEQTVQSGIVSVEPNPTFSISQVEFELNQSTTVSLYLLDENGKKHHPFIDNRSMKKGRYTIGLDLLDVTPGNHQLILETSQDKYTFDLLRVSRLETEAIE